MQLQEDKTRTRLLDAAGQIFAERGFEKGTVREICARAEVNLAAVNYHFGDKAKLYLAALMYAFEVVFDQVPLPDWDETVTPEQKLRDFIKMLVHRLLLAKGLPWQTRLMMRELMAPSDAFGLTVENYIRPIHNQLLQILDELLPPETTQAERIRTAFSIVGQCMFYKTNAASISRLVPEELRQEHFSSEQVIEHVSRFTLAALKNVGANVFQHQLSSPE